MPSGIVGYTKYRRDHLRNEGSGDFGIFKIMFIVVVVLFLFFLILQPQLVMEGVQEGLLLWYRVVLPAQLPFVIGVKLLFRCCSFRKIPAHLLCMFTGMISGYPIGALSAAQLYQQGRVDSKDLAWLAASSNMAGPLFVIGTVGTGLLQNPLYGYSLLGVHWMSAWLMCIWGNRGRFCARRKKKTNAAENSKSFGIQSVNVIVEETAELMLKIAVYIALFAVIRKGCGEIAGALLEITGGIRWLAEQPWDVRYKLSGCSFLINFSGLCILMQSLGVMEKAPVAFGKFILYKGIQGCFGAGIMLLFCHIFSM